MVFSSLAFLFFLLPAVWITNALCPPRYRNALLTLWSVFFYYWGESWFLLCFGGIIIANFITGKWITTAESSSRKKVLLFLGCSLNLLVLFYFKYAFFVLDTVGLAGGFEAIALPLGISFFTFQGISYLVDVYHGVIPPEKKFVDYCFYQTFFPQLIAGPIVRYRDVYQEIYKRVVTSEDLACGVKRFVIGLAKKVLIANVLAQVVDDIFAMPSGELTFTLCWIGVLFYGMQLYYDFSAYSDMAIGLGRMFGFKYKENFNHPYSSRSITDFWRRWHISLSSWFRDYLYIPLGGNRKSKLMTFRNLLIVFALCGFWHGAEWTFILWGLYHGIFLIVERILRKSSSIQLPKILLWLYTFIVIHLGWLLFRAESLGQYEVFFFKMMEFHTLGGSVLSEISSVLTRETALIYALAFLFSQQYLLEKLIRVGNSFSLRNSFTNITGRVLNIVSLQVLLILSLARLASQTYNPFIYFRF